MARNITVGIDLGTAVTRTVVLSWQDTSGVPEILAASAAPTKGLRHGYIVNVQDAARSIKQSVSLAEKESGIAIKRAVISLGGTSLSAETTNGSAIISKSDGEITSFDIKTAQQNAEENLELKNKRVIYSTPLIWKLDGKELSGKPHGMHGVKLEVKILSVSCLSQHLDDLLAATGEAGIEIDDVVPSPYAASTVALTDRQKAVGVLLANIGAETVSIAVFENSMLIGLSVLPIGSTDITNDIALGFRIPLEEAEGIKTGTVTTTSYPKRKIDEIIEARLSDIFELIDGYLKKIKRSGLLPAGIVLVGGGSNTSLAEGLAKEMLRLPARIGSEDLLPSIQGKLRDSSWFVAFGAALLGKEGEARRPERRGGGAKGLFREFLKQFLP